MNTLSMLESHFGLERLLRALPQREVKAALGLSTVTDLARSADMSEAALRRRMERGEIPYPTEIIQRRAYFTREQATDIQRRLKAMI